MLHNAALIHNLLFVLWKRPVGRFGLLGGGMSGCCWLAESARRGARGRRDWGRSLIWRPVGRVGILQGLMCGGLGQIGLPQKNFRVQTKKVLDELLSAGKLSIVFVTEDATCGQVAQLVEHRTENPSAEGSSPPLTTI